jgi:hypothetical protein
VKTKIIYISGAENLDRAAIKMAFDEVRQTLGLDSETLLFGVPLDEETADSSQRTADSADVAEVDNIQPVADAPKPKRARKIKSAASPTENIEQPAPEEQLPERVIPILSVLSGGRVDEPPKEVIEIVEIAEEADETDEMAADEVIEEEFTASLDEDLPADAPKIPQTIEDIFENLTPLPEEKIIECARAAEDDSRSDDLEDDATLNKLAAEFVEVIEAPVSEPVKPSRTSRLKNILPFKKAKKDEPGVLGDLFGWAGIAANDDDVISPGFFAAR